MNIYDLSHKLNNQSPVYPGIQQPEFIPATQIETHGYRETHFRFHSHLGTHIDAPAHMIADGYTLDQLPVGHFCGEAIIIRTETKNRIDIEIFNGLEDKIAKSDFVLFNSGWSKLWGSPAYFGNFPVPTPNALKFLLQFNLKGIGFDHISADSMDSKDFPNHYAILGKNMIIIENLVFPDGFDENSGEFSCFPLPYENADGSPVRAVLKCKKA
ncbi:MAG: cyclase family protein [Draconibacterium sp.]